MSRTYHHLPWWKRLEKGFYVPRYLQRYGYEWWSGRPRSETKTCGMYGMTPSSWWKKWTHRIERRWAKIEINKEVV